MTALTALSRAARPNETPFADPIRAYWAAIERGDVVVGDKIRRTYAHLVSKLDTDADGYHYSPARAAHVIDFIERYCHHSKGKVGGQPVRLELWEKAMLAAIFGFVDMDGNRQYREALLIVGKKNGKSLLASAVGLYLMIGDGEPGPEVYAVATKRDQAKIIWQEAKRMVRKSPALLKRIKTLTHELTSEAFNDGVFKPLASDSDTLDGLNVHGVLMDEIHQWKDGRALYNIMADGTTAREQPLVFITSTAGTVREDIYDDRYEYAARIINGYGDPKGAHDPHFIAFVYELGARREWTDPNCWAKANPGLGTIKNRKQLADKVARAQANPKEVKNLVCKEFNIRETTTEAWLTFEELNNTACYDLAELQPRYGVGGVDLSATTDLTAAAVIFQVPNDPHYYVRMMFWLPEALLEQRVNEDKIRYDLWVDEGYVRLCQGNKINYHDVVQWFVEVQEQEDIYLPWIGYDSWSATYFVDELTDTFGPSCPEPVIQGKKTLSAPMHALGADLAAKLVVYNNNPVLKWCLANTSYDEDKNGNWQPCKSTKPTRRIDGAAALLDAYTVLGRHLEEYQSMI